MRIGPTHTPDVIKWLIGANVVVHLLASSVNMAPFALFPVAVWESGHLWQIFTYMWLHGGMMHLVFNMLGLWMFGSEVAAHWGMKRFLTYYLICGIGAGFVIAIVPAFLHAMDPGSPSYHYPTIGASGAVYGVLLAHSLLWPSRTIMLLFPPIPLKAIYLIPLLFLMDMLNYNAQISHTGHLGGVVIGWILLWRWGITGVPTLGRAKMRYRRWKMRRNLRSVQNEDLQSRRQRDDDARERRRRQKNSDGNWMN